MLIYYYMLCNVWVPMLEVLLVTCVIPHIKLVLFSVVHNWYKVIIKTSMINDREIQEWWTKKLENYLKNYSRRNKMTLAQVRRKLFTETHENYLNLSLLSLSNSLKSFMTKTNDLSEWLLMHKLSNSGQKNFYEWLEKVIENFCEEQALKERTSFAR